jgi:hypothetical protein
MKNIHPLRYRQTRLFMGRHEGIKGRVGSERSGFPAGRTNGYRLRIKTSLEIVLAGLT